MASLIKNDKGFKVVKLTIEEIATLEWGINSTTCLCMSCNNPIKGDILFPVVLNDTFCQECYDDWYATAINYHEDRQYENRKYSTFKEVCNMLNIEITENV